MHTAIIPTAEGVFTACYSERGLAGLQFPRAHAASEKKARRGASPWPKEVRHWHQLTVAALREQLRGQAPEQLPPLDLSAGTEFRQRIWRELRRLAPGETVSYAQLAARAGHPKASRAAGGACGANPIPVLVPCHRVLATDGRRGGFSGGLDWKRRLLEREGVSVVPASVERVRARATSSANNPSGLERPTSRRPSRLR